VVANHKENCVLGVLVDILEVSTKVLSTVKTRDCGLSEG